MPLAEYKPPRRRIEFPGGSFEVRAFSLQDVAVIVDTHQWAIEKIYIRLKINADEGREITEALAIEIMMDLVRESPTLAGNVIALAADEPEPESMRIAATLPLMTQIEALTAVGELTFTDIASVKKFGADVMKLIGGILPMPTVTAAAA